MFSLSCAWNWRLHTNGKDMIAQIKAIGFRSVELNFSLTDSMVNDIINLKNNNQIEIASIHNFCPLPDGISINQATPDYYNLASLIEEERRKAIFYTRRTIELAKRLDARCIILHCGRVEVKDKTKDLFEAKNTNPLRYDQLKKEMTRERTDKIAAHLEKLLLSLAEINKFAKDCGISIGIENRYYYREIPSMEEIGIILGAIKDSNLYYWHDVGHAQVWENLGLCTHLDFLRNYNKRMIGIHLHDIIGIKDHKAPLEGSFDFNILKPFIHRDLLFVLEPHQPATQDEIKKAVMYLENLFKDELL